MIKFLKFIPAQLTFFLILGIIVGSNLYIHVIQLALILSCLIILLLIVHQWTNKQFNSPAIFTVIVFLLSFFIGIGSITYKNQLNTKFHYSKKVEFSINVPLFAEISIDKILKENTYYYRYEAEVIQLNNNKTIGKIVVNIKKDSITEQLNVNDKLVIKTVFKEVQKPLNPYGFNYKKYLQNQQIYHQVYINKFLKVRLFKNTKTLKSIAANFRKNINKTLIKNSFKNDELAVINALLLGQKNNISKELQQNYAGAGAIHILAVSGLHVGIIYLILAFLLKPLHYFKNGKLIATFFVVLALWVYAIIAGLSASVVRAVTMFTAVAISLSVNRPTNVYNTLIVSMFFLLLFNPFYLFEIGFQLSYLAVFSIVWIQPKLYNLYIPKLWILDKVWQLFTVSLAAQIGVLPLSLFYFHQFPGLFFLSNLVIIPFLGIILTLGVIVIVFSFLNILPPFLGDLYRFIIEQMNNFVVWVSHQESFLVQNIPFSFALMTALYTVILFTIKWTEKKSFNRLVLLLISVIVIQITVIFEKYKRNSTNEFVVFNKSNASLISKRNGNKITINTSIDSLHLNESALKSYLIGVGISKYKVLPYKNVFKFNDKIILVVDSLGVYKLKKIKLDIIILQHSPKINLARLIKFHQPEIIIADASNYKNYIETWKQTCAKKGTPFYSTIEKGAFILRK